MAKPSPTRQLLNDLLEGYVPDETALVDLFVDPPDEDQWLDYKAGAIMAEPKKAARVVREYISGFANAEGGTLILGFDHKKRVADGLKAPGTASLHDWAVSALAPLPALPPPRIVPVNVRGDDVLLVAVTRSRSLVYTIEEGAAVYYFRFGDSTRVAPSYLIADLMLGRRSEAELQVSLRSVDLLVGDVAGIRLNANIACGTLTLHLKYSNVGLRFAEGVRGGIVAPALSKGPLPPAMARLVDIGTVPTSWAIGEDPPAWTIWYRNDNAQGQNPARTLGPFEEAGDAIGYWTLPLFRDLTGGAEGNDEAMSHARGALEVKAGLFVLAKGSEPWWHQLTVQYDQRSIEQPNKHALFRLEPLGHERPKIAVRFMPAGWKARDWTP